MNKTIYLEIDEEITEVIDKLKKAEEDQLAFVIPRNSTLAQSVINLKLLLRAANESNKRICIVSNDSVTQNLSGQLGIETFGRVSEIKDASWEKTPETVASEQKPSLKIHNYQAGADAETEIEKELEAEAEEPEPIEVKTVSIEKAEEPEEELSQDKEHLHNKLPRELRGGGAGGNGRRKAFNIFLAALALSGIVLWYIFLPSASVKVYMDTADYAQKFEVTVDKNITELDSKNATLPGVMVEFEKHLTKTYPATGTKNLGEKSKGTLTFSNTTGVDQQVNSGTELTGGGVKFTIDKNVIIPKGSLDANGRIVAGTITGPVTSVDGGAATNVSGETFSISGKTVSVVYATGTTSGGTDREVKVVSADDLQKANIALKDSMLNEGKVELLDKAARTEVKAIDTSVAFELMEIQYNKAEGDEADQFDAIGSGKLTVLGFAEQDLFEFVVSLASVDLGSSKTIINPSAAEIKYTIISNDNSTGKLKLAVDFTGKSGQKIEDSVVKNKSVGKRKSSVRSDIAKMEGVSSVEISLSPSFIPTLPFKKDRIEVVFDYTK